MKPIIPGLPPNPLPKPKPLLPFKTEIEPNTMTYNKPSLMVLLEYAINELETKGKVKVLDVRIGINTVVVYEKVGQK